MSAYFKPGRGWRFDFTLNGRRHTNGWYRTKAEARQAEAKTREELLHPPPVAETSTGMAFLELINLRLDYVRAYKCHTYYQEHVYLARKLVRIWKGMSCEDLTTRMVQAFLLQRGKVSALAANKDLRYLRAAFNFGIKQGLIKTNPSNGLEFMPVDRKLKYVPPKEDVAQVLLAAEPEVQDYLVAIMDTMARVGEINRLTWNDVNFEERCVVLLHPQKERRAFDPPEGSHDHPAPPDAAEAT